MGTILLAVIGQTLFATIAGFWAAAMKRRWWVWVLVSLFLTPIVAYIGLIIVFFTSGQPRRIANVVKQGAQSSYGAIKEHVSGESPMDDGNKEFYTKAGSEIASKTYDQALFTKAFSESAGDENKAKALYIRYRVNELRQQHKKAKEEVEQQRIEAELQQLKRTEEAAEKQRNEAARQRQAEWTRQCNENARQWKEAAQQRLRDQKAAAERRKAEGKLSWFVWKIILAAAAVLAVVILIIPNHVRWKDEERQAEFNQRREQARQERFCKVEIARQAEEKRLAEINQRNEQARQEQVRKEEQDRLVANTRGKDGKTPLIIAAQEGKLDAVKFSVDKGANVNAIDNYGWTPLMYATWEGHLDVVQYLVDKGANVNAKDFNGWTPLMHAAWKGHLDVVKYLMDKGARQSH